MGDALNLTEELELILDLDQVVTGGRVETLRHLDGERDEVLHDQVNDITDTVLAFIAANGGVKLNFAIGEGHFDVKDGSQAVLHVVLVANLLSHVGHGGVNTIGNTLNDKTIDVVDVAFPFFALLVGTNVIGRILHELVNLFTLATDSVESGNYSGIM